MPVIRGIFGPLSKEKKSELIKRLTEVSVEITGTPEQAHTVIIESVDFDSIGVGTKTVEALMKENPTLEKENK